MIIDAPNVDPPTTVIDQLYNGWQGKLIVTNYNGIAARIEGSLLVGTTADGSRVFEIPSAINVPESFDVPIVVLRGEARYGAIPHLSISTDGTVTCWGMREIVEIGVHMTFTQKEVEQ